MPEEMPEEVSVALATPLGQTFKRLFSEDGFAVAIADDPDAALAGLDLSDEEREAIITDAEALEGEVSGFALRDPLAMIGTLGGMRTPSRLGVSPSTLGWVGCLTCT
jgi:hypothetical protein